MNKRDLRLQAKAEARAARLAGSQRNNEDKSAPTQSVEEVHDSALQGGDYNIDEGLNSAQRQFSTEEASATRHSGASLESTFEQGANQRQSNRVAHSDNRFREISDARQSQMMTSDSVQARERNEQRMHLAAFEDLTQRTLNKPSYELSLEEQGAKGEVRSPQQDGFLFDSRLPNDDLRKKREYAAALEAQMAESRSRNHALAESRESRAVFADESAARENERVNARKAYAAALKMQMTEEKSRRRPQAESRETRAVFADEGALRENERADARKVYASALREQMREDARRKATHFEEGDSDNLATQTRQSTKHDLDQIYMNGQRRDAANSDADVRRHVFARDTMAAVQQPTSQGFKPQMMPHGHYNHTDEKRESDRDNFSHREERIQIPDYPVSHLEPHRGVMNAVPSQRHFYPSPLPNEAARSSFGAVHHQMKYYPSSIEPSLGDAMVPRAGDRYLNVQYLPGEVRPNLHERAVDPSQSRHQPDPRYYHSQQFQEDESSRASYLPPQQIVNFHAAPDRQLGFSLQESVARAPREVEQQQLEAHTSAFPDGLRDARPREAESARIAAELREQIREKEERKRLQNEARLSSRTPPGYRLGPTGQLVRLDPRDDVARLKVEAMAKTNSQAPLNPREQTATNQEETSQLEIGGDRDEAAIRKAKNDEYARQLQADMVAREERRRREAIEKEQLEAKEESKLERERVELEAAYKRNEQPKPWMVIPEPKSASDEKSEDDEEDQRRRRLKEEEEALQRQRQQDAEDDARIKRERAELAARLKAEPERPIDVSKASKGQYPIEFLSEEYPPTLESPGIPITEPSRLPRPISTDSRISTISSVAPPPIDFPESEDDVTKCSEQTSTVPEPPPPPVTIWERSPVTSKASMKPYEIAKTRKVEEGRKNEEYARIVTTPDTIGDWRIPPSREAVYDYKTIELLPMAVANLQAALDKSSPLAKAGKKVMSNRSPSSASIRDKSRIEVLDRTTRDTQAFNETKVSPVPSPDLATIQKKNKRRLDNIVELENAADEAIAVCSGAEVDDALERLVAAAGNRPTTSDVIKRPDTGDTEQSLPNAVRWATRQPETTSSRQSLFDRRHGKMLETPSNRQWSSLFEASQDQSIHVAAHR